MVELKNKAQTAVRSPDELEAAFQAAVRRALRHHNSIGNPIATSVDGKIVWIAPEDINVPED